MRGTYESIVSIKDLESTKRVETISKNAQWFENNSPTDKKFKKKKVEGISGKAIDVTTEIGASSPTTPIGVNLPNQRYLKEKYGSKSVTLSNILYSYNQVSKKSGALEEFSYSKEEVNLSKKYSTLANELLVDLHEIVGHGSGKTKQGVGDYMTTLKNYGNTIEEARADLFALYFIMDKKLIDLKLVPSQDVGKTLYNEYIKGGLMLQLIRIKPGENIEEAHLRDRQIICKWVYEQGKGDNVIEKKIKNKKTYFVVNDYQKLRGLFGKLLKEVQRIVSVGDFKAAKKLVETYGVKIDKKLHNEVIKRWTKLNIAPFSAFINPLLKPVYSDSKKLNDVKVIYPNNFEKQMLFYSKNYSFLPLFN
jgi:dipeptidyl-peptidase-3